MKKRTAARNRKTKETDIAVRLNIDGTGKAEINTKIGFLDHMLELFAFWGCFDLDITTKKADLNIDIHHANEDVGIALGQAFDGALGKNRMGIRRIASASVPMEEVVASVILDLSGRGSCQVKQTPSGESPAPQDGYSFEHAKHFFESFAKTLGVNLHISIDKSVRDLHTTLEPVFKALGIALDQATQIDPRRKGVPSTKGVID